MQHSPGGFREIDASTLMLDHELLLPDGLESSVVQELDTVLDDYDNPGFYFAVLANGVTIRVAHGARVRVRADAEEAPAEAAGDAAPRAPRPADLLFSGAATPAAPAGPDGEPTVLPEAAEQHSTEEDSTEEDSTGQVASVDDSDENQDQEVPAKDPGPEELTQPEEPEGVGSGPLAFIPQPTATPEELLARVSSEHGEDPGVRELCDRLSRGVNLKSGACLRDLQQLARTLYVVRRDSAAALDVADLLTVLPFDGNLDRWSSIETSLALAAQIARERGIDARATAYSELLRASESVEEDPFRARVAARVRQRALNEPELYDQEIGRAVEAADSSAEREWRILRLTSLLRLRAHGGSEVFDDAQLDERIAEELAAVRG